MPRTAESIQFRCMFYIFNFFVARIAKNLAFTISFKSNLTANIRTLLNLEPNFGFMLEIKSIQNYPHRNTISTNPNFLGYPNQPVCMGMQIYQDIQTIQNVWLSNIKAYPNILLSFTDFLNGILVTSKLELFCKGLSFS